MQLEPAHADQTVYEQATILAVFSRAQIDSEAEISEVWRRDACGAWISSVEYGNRDSEYGWEIEQIIPAAEGGTTDLSNLVPLQWQNKAARSGGECVCVVTAHGGENRPVVSGERLHERLRALLNARWPNVKTDRSGGKR